MQQTENLTFSDSVFTPKLLVGDSASSISCADLANQFIVQLGPACELPSPNLIWTNASPMSIATAIAAFCVAVCRIVVVGPWKDMRRVAARRVVAAVKPHQLSKVDACYKQISNAMRAALLLAGVKSTILLTRSANPRPAFIWRSDLDVTPKSSNVGFAKLRDWFTLYGSHLISSVDRLVRADAVRQHYVGSSYFTPTITAFTGISA